MGLEGYLINEFIVVCINYCDDEWGGSYENCICFLIEIVKCICVEVGENFIIIYCFLMLDLVECGLILEEVI